MTRFYIRIPHDLWDFAFAGSRWQFERCSCKDPTSWGHWQCFYGFEYCASAAFPAPMVSFCPCVQRPRCGKLWSFRRSSYIWPCRLTGVDSFHLCVALKGHSNLSMFQWMLKQMLYVWTGHNRILFILVLLYVLFLLLVGEFLQRFMTGVTLMQWSKHRWISHAKPLTCNDPWSWSESDRDSKCKICKMHPKFSDFYLCLMGM